MEIHSFTFNPFAENTYLLSSLDKAIIIDAGMMDGQECNILDVFLADKGLTLVGSLLTHAHIDHVLGLHHVADTYGITTRSHPEGEPVFESCPKVSQMYGVPYTPVKEVHYNLDVNKDIQFGDTTLTMRYAPGHAPGHVVFIDEESRSIIAGDTLFQSSIGRTDLPGGDHALLLEKIRTELFSLDDAYTVYPGHGPSTTIGFEKRNNPFLT